MDFTNEDLAFAIVLLLIFLLIIGILYSVILKRKGRRNYINSVTFFGATSEFHDVEKKAAVEHMLEVQADKKMEEEESGEPENK